MSERLEFTIGRIKEIDSYRNLHRSVPTVLFLVSGAFALRSFFWLIDLMNWLNVDKLHSVLPSSISFVLIFVVWLLAFLACMSLLELLKLKNIHASILSQIYNSDLSSNEVCELRDILNSKTWNHEQILRDIAVQLKASQRRDS